MTSGLEKKLLLTCLLIGLFFPFSSWAYREISGEGNLNLQIEPSNPKPGDQVSISIGSYSLDIDTAAISWSLNNKIVASGIGLKDFNFKLNPNAQDLLLIRAQRGEDLAEKLLVFDHSTVDLLWETNTTIPPDYQGKALISSGSKVKIVAVADFTNKANKNLTPNQINYQWVINGKLRPDLSGVAKDQISITTDLNPSPDKIKVTATSIDGLTQAENSLTIPLVKPEILLYPLNPLTGPDYTQIIPNNYNLKNNITTIKAEPFYFSDRSALNFNWIVGGTEVASDQTKPDQLILQAKNNFSGSVDLEVKINNSNNYRQTADLKTLINYNPKNISF